MRTVRIDRGQLAIRPGDKLPNQATVLANHWFSVADTEMLGIVLAVTGPRSAEPFVTWERSVAMTVTATGRDQQVDMTYWGHYHRDIASALADYERRVEEKDVDLRNAKAIAQRGHDDGKAAASWIVDGNTSDPYAVLDELIDGMDDGDPEILDKLPHPRVGGEFADDPTWEQICMEEIERYGDDGEQDLFDTYHRSFHEGVEAGIREMHSHYKEALGA